ncbi:SDR family oxidoreductase [Acuticoccus sp. I52.16.1]|uniref:SDR family NAD(P)-dependent oxidoreductase n=1 Tax=Acuticoccus sp. I52.16.1 TaxID=2928472 RepID=UPI001FD56FE7|nr:SDR family oxidoreductase [Acuticoccus sp. I52.16.1]UOM36216.1 SDR family oxidoreductase [Acuticoccus sp. I52.16.1]
MAQLALVTGASSGIGEALAQRIAADGVDLILVARREDRLRALAADLPVEAHVVPLDLTERGAPEALMAEVARYGRPIDILVNNAGFGHAGAFAKQPLEPELGMVDLNIRALVELTHRVLPLLIERGHGGILNVASTAAFVPGPFVSVYYASKAFVLSLSEGLSEEVRGTGVTVTALCPGPTTSEFGAVSGMEHSRLFKGVKRMSSPQVADIGWAGFKAGRRVVIPGWQNRMSSVVTKHGPHRLLLPVIRYLQS